MRLQISYIYKITPIGYRNNTTAILNGTYQCQKTGKTDANICLTDRWNDLNLNLKEHLLQIISKYKSAHIRIYYE